MTKEEKQKLIEELENKTCKSCHQKLSRIPWNTQYDVLRCENTKCVSFLTPQGSIPVPTRTMAKVNDKEIRIHRFED